MEFDVAAAVLCAALLHAGWNALVRINTDRLVALTLIAGGAGLAALLAGRVKDLGPDARVLAILSEGPEDG